ncbi:Uncharacterised protein [uncultured archaeon]|nr:Uncharacterised protein [uncultured archaeon]
MKKVVLSSILILVVLLSFSMVSASWLTGAWGKISGNAVVDKADILGDCVKTCTLNACPSSLEGFSKKICTSKNYNLCLNTCKTPAQNVPLKINTQVAKVLDLNVSRCIANVCKLYESEKLTYEGIDLSMDAISNNLVSMNINGKKVGLKNSFINQEMFKIVFIELPVSTYNPSAIPSYTLRSDITPPVYTSSLGRNFVIFSIYKNKLPALKNATIHLGRVNY